MKILCIASLCTLAAVAAADGNCIPATIDFSELPNGEELKGGDYLSNEWYNTYGLSLSATGGLGNKPRLFNTSDIGTRKYGDPDLGSPNERCPNPGPGRGEGGEPGAPGANCEPLGNVLIIQENNRRPEIPDDNVDGGVITFIFSEPRRIKSIGLLDVDYASFLRVFFPEDNSEDIKIPKLGDNSVQTVSLEKDGVYKLELHLERSGAVTFLSFCYPGKIVSIGEECPGGNESCETGYCFYSSDDPEEAPLCTCNPSNNAGCDDRTVCAFQEGYGYSCFLKIGEPCYGGGCVTEYCFNAVLPGGVIPAGVCACNPSNNAGCEDPYKCDFSPLVEIGPPDCFRPVGSAGCESDAKCLSDHCFSGQCVCNEDLDDFPCSENEECTFEEGDGYVCKTSEQKLGLDEPCMEDSECETNYCFADWFIKPDQPGLCKCNSRTNVGCPEDKVCFSGILPGSPPACFLQVGFPCVKDDECFSGSCFSEKCAACDEDLGYPCSPFDEVCVFDEASGHYCKELLMIDQPCQVDGDCQSGNCWADWLITAEQPGLCRCNLETNEGCDYIYVCQSPLAPGSAPSCFTPVGSNCQDGDECYSGYCYDGSCAACDEFTNYPCNEGEVCLFDGGTDHFCQTLLGKSCRYTAQCPFGTKTLPCWKEYPIHGPGMCVCDKITNDGCAGDRTCAVRPGTFNMPPSCFNPIGKPCVSEEDCLSHACINGKCVCNVETNYPCAVDEACIDQDSEYACRKCIIDDVQCYREIPMTCPDGCEYQNECLANQAGFNTRLECYYSNKFALGPTGNLYKVFESLGSTWTEANDAANALSKKCDMRAHLATITSSEEDVFVHELGREFHSYYGIRSFWVGGVQNVNSPAFKEPGGGWEWVNGEGTIATKTHPNTELYSNWAPKEPNDFRNQPQNPDHLPENHMTVGRHDTSLADDVGKATGWNDEFEGPYIRGYIVEVEVESTVIYKKCDSKVDNLRLPPVRKECPPGQISSLIEGCAKYNDEPVLDGCIMHIISELKSAGLINEEESDSLRSCIS